MRQFAKIPLLMICLVPLFSGCLIYDETGLNADHVSGSVARGRILNAAIVADASVLATTTGVIGVSFLALLAPDNAGIVSNAYYRTADVDACVERIVVLGGGAGLASNAAFSCGLVPVNPFWGN